MSAPLDQSRKLLVPVHGLDTTYVSGLAVLKAAVEGYNLPISNEQLFQQTQFNGEELSVDQIAATLPEVGLQTEQHWLPADALSTVGNRLPLIVPLKTETTPVYYALLWQRIGPYWQLLDPFSGRRWLTTNQLQALLHPHSMTITADEAAARLESTAYITYLQKRIQALRLPYRQAQKIRQYLNQTWSDLVVLDMAVRFISHLVSVGGISRGRAAGNALQQLLDKEREDLQQLIPVDYWAYQFDEDDPETLTFHGIPLLEIRGRNTTFATTPPEHNPFTFDRLMGEPERLIWQVLREDGWLAPAAVVSGLFLAGIGLTFEIFLLQGLLQLGQQLSNMNQRIFMLVAIFLFFIVLLALLLAIDAIGRQQGRRIEVRLRVAFLEKIPRLPLWFFQRTPVSGLTQRGYTLRSVHVLPDLAQKFIQTGFQILFTAIGLILLEPSGGWFVILLVIFTLLWPYLTQPIMAARSLGLAEENNSLSRIYLDALLGVVPVRVHSAETTVWRRHQSMLVSWVYANLNYFRFTTIVQVIGLLISTALNVAIVFNYIYRGSEIGSILLVTFWSINLPLLGQRLVEAMQEYLQKRAIVQMLLQPLLIPDAAPLLTTLSVSRPPEANPEAVHIVLENVTVAVDDVVILQEIDLEIQAGEQIAVVGPSGAGKSTLASLVLGWLSPAAGQILIDGQPLEGEYVELLRRETAWVDPAVQLWNRSLLYNLWYANQSDLSAPLGDAVEQADLFDVLQALPQGLQTMLGENGRLLSGGQGQRVRLARAMLQEEIRLVVLDEAFRGLDREKRSQLLAQARTFWPNATMICITHDVSQTEGFSRVLVVENGRIIEDSTPEELKQRETSRYQDLLDAEDAVRRTLWQSADWKRLHLADGQLTVKEPPVEEVLVAEPPESPVSIDEDDKKETEEPVTGQPKSPPEDIQDDEHPTTD